MPPSRELRILFLEDQPIDVELALEQLRQHGIQFGAKVVVDERDFLTGLRDFSPDLILVDHTLPSYDGLSALAAARKERPETPFIFVSGTLGEEVAIEALVRGATDYVLKQRLERLGPSVLRALGEVEERAQRLQAEETLRKNERRLRLALEASNAGTWSWDVASNVSTWDERYHAMYGFGPEEAPGFEVWMARVHPEDQGRLRAQIAALLKPGTGDAWNQEFRAVHPVKGERWMAGMGRIERDSSGKAVRLAGINLDVTERKRLETEREINIRLLGLLNSSSDLHELMRQVTALFHQWFGCDAVGIRLREGDDFPYFETRGFPAEFVQAENQLCHRDAQGRPLRDTQGNPVLECMCGNVLCGRFNPAKPFFTGRGSFWSNCTTQLLASTTEADRQVRTRNRCNGEGYESVALVALRVGQTTYGLLQVNDKRKDQFSPERIALIERLADSLAVAIAHRQDQQRLRKSEARFRRMVDSNIVGIVIANAAGKIIEANDYYLRLVGVTREEFDRGGVDWRTITPPEWLPADENAIREMRERGTCVPYEKEYIRRDGTRVPVYHVDTILPGPGEELAAFVLDLTKRKHAEDELKKSRQQLRALAGRLQAAREAERTRIAREIHDKLGQALTALKMDLRWIENKLSSSPAALAGAMVDRVVEAGNYVDSITAAVQELALELRPGALDNLGLEAAVRLETQRFQQRSRVGCELSLPATLATVPPDIATAVFRVLQEALTNVLRHARASKVRLTLETRDRSVLLTVQDDGVGIDEEKTHAPTSLGLFGMNERAAQLGGEFNIRRVSPRGTIATLQIPLPANPQPRTRP